MQPFGVVDADVVFVSVPKVQCVFVGIQVNVVVFDVAPEPLDVDVVGGPSASVHADSEFRIIWTFADQRLDEHLAGELASMVGVEYLRASVPQECLLSDFRAPFRLHRVAQAPAHDATAEHVNDGCEVHKTVTHRDVGDVHLPHLIRTDDVEPAQQIRVLLVFRCRNGCFGLRAHGF